ncbi:MAG: hypothetical protein AAEJ65_10255 [Planctomycetota bacterium]|jgi:chromosome segregation ATPase
MKGFGLLPLIIVLILVALFLFTGNYQQRQIDNLERTQVTMQREDERLADEVIRLGAEVVGIRTGLEGVQTEMVEIEKNIATVALESENLRAGITSDLENLNEGLATKQDVLKKELAAELGKMKSALEGSDNDQQSLKDRIFSLEGQLEVARQDRIELATRHLILEEVLKDLANTQQLLEKAIQRIENPLPDPEK